MAKRTLPVPDLPRPVQNRIRNKPIWFANNFLGVQPWQKQKDILHALRDNDYVAVRSCNGSGKTYTAALATLWWLMAHDEAIVITTAPSERQVKQLLWREIRSLYNKNKELIGGKITQTRLELSNKRYAYGFSTDTADRFQGFHSPNILIVVDEASGLREYLFDPILGCLTSDNSKLLMIGNPLNLSGTFYDAFHKNRAHFATIHISAFDTPAFQENTEGPVGGPSPFGTKGDASERSKIAGVCTGGRGAGARPNDTTAFLANRTDHVLARNDEHPNGIATPKFVENVARQRGTKSVAYMVRVLGDFPEEADDTLIPLRDIEAAARRSLPCFEEDEAVMGVDIARYGNDLTVLVVRRGPQVIDMVALRRSGLMETAGRIVNMAKDHDVKAVHIDEVGMGAGVLDALKERDLENVIGVNGGTKSDSPERFVNRRAQLYYGLKQRFEDDDIAIPDDAELISQLAALTHTYNARGQLVLETKDKIRRSGHQSPDKADALALAFHKPQPPKLPPPFMYIPP